METAFQGVRMVQGMISATSILEMTTGPNRIPGLPKRSAPEGLIPKPKSFQVIKEIPGLRNARRKMLFSKQTVGLVPTMGALHKGHLDLIRLAAQENDFVVVSIYVNPTQFGVNEDLSSYPRTWDRDLDKLRELCLEFILDDKMGQITMVFSPSTEEMYPGLAPTSKIDGEGSFVTITPLSNILEGASRPVFFRGVATVVLKLLNIVQPEKVYFGQKDIQQTAVIRRMVKDFHVNTQIRIAPTVRDPGGLALSSRNIYLGKRRRAVATVLIQSLKAAQQVYAKGRRTRNEVLAAAHDLLSSVQETQGKLPPSQRAMFEVDYISLAHPDTLKEIEEVRNSGAILSGAVKMLPIEEPEEGEDTGVGGGKSPVRLIDNIYLDVFSSVIGKISEVGNA